MYRRREYVFHHRSRIQQKHIRQIPLMGRTPMSDGNRNVSGMRIQNREKQKRAVRNIIHRIGYLGIASEYVRRKGYHEAIDVYIETHTPYLKNRTMEPTSSCSMTNASIRNLTWSAIKTAFPRNQEHLHVQLRQHVRYFRGNGYRRKTHRRTEQGNSSVRTARKSEEFLYRNRIAVKEANRRAPHAFQQVDDRP